ncbi:hybrid sensor histidine kinase/response regulator [Pseudogemmobacter humi]|uniref:histidine kinase n=1 Tax=Pseudogemmobacter humi TaxID=2483812 RepID=A0A3P5X8T0_9RHOB|nr:hybrid sensor histidine kinase/response regulator [Pseudogemmobacter humi]VDC24849.1 Autoinducer 2 sensor kinase/phosphatase LuxQ [Pseudogemmobacter humi]
MSAAAAGQYAAATLDNLRLPVSYWSADLKLLSWNPAFAERFSCFPAGIPTGITRDRFIDAVERAGLLVQIETRPAETGEATDAPTLYFSDGSIYRLESWQAPDGCRTTICLDITTAQRNERALRKARDAATAADQSKSRFLRAANHDLRQPLAAMKILIYSCIGAREEAERQQALHAMEVSVAIMEDLLGALLNIGQLDAGRIHPSIQTFQISAILERLRIQFDHQAREKGLELRIIPSTAAVVSDRVLLERILSNFVSNAIRYTEVGRVVIGCKQAGGQLQVHVIDTGPGIAPEFREEIFEEFFRISKHQDKRRHSLGLGLNISRRLADILGHRIMLRSLPGRGSDFAIEMPVGNIWHSTISEPEISEQIGGEFAGLACLLLEDDPHVREALAALLERWGITVLNLVDLSDIPRSLAALDRAPDIIVTDYRLHREYLGTEIVNEVNDILEKPCPALVITADTGPELIAGIRAQGYPVLIKPVGPPGLRVVMHNLLFEPEAVPELN